ncbi:adenylate cyclase associated N terminal-domain-containing protein [Gymnopilus junonius]|uniref:Adenylyl cyclase-associated protein n=1 Tax=Gymnopilus junonius TaxID=109634 RepID=A0A9P5NZ81_GYMJU|nr:adenylate cyclase associated N terminal-domain-containing protein [Gymnopilus junonius]
MSTVSSTGLHSLATLIKRLEAAASRFEDIVVNIDPSNLANRTTAEGAVQNPAQGPSTSSAAPPPPPPPPPPPSAPVPAAPVIAEVPKSVSAFQERVIDAKLKPFVEFTQGFAGPNVVEIVGLVKKQYDILYEFLKLAAACQKPDQKTLESLLKPFLDSIEAVSRSKEANRRDRDWFSHLTIIGEGAPVIGWVINAAPVQSITDIKDSVVYYGNRVKQEYKDKNPKHAEWVNLYVGVLDAMQAYVKEYYTTGLTWNPKGVPVADYKSSSASSGAPAPPPPPPPPPAPSAPAPTSGGAAAVFAEINRGEEVTKGLRKVDKSEMTHKNPALRASSVVPASASSPSSPSIAGKKPIKPSKPQALAGKKPSKFALEGNKWLIEYHENETITVENVEIQHSINIYGCKNTTVVITGKVNGVNIINSTKTSVLVQSVIASISVTASPSFQLQITGTAPMIQLDSTDSGQIYLSKDSLSAEITTAKCSAINISLPVEGEEEGVFQEQPVPEMFKTVVKNGKLVTTTVEHSG